MLVPPFGLIALNTDQSKGENRYAIFYMWIVPAEKSTQLLRRLLKCITISYDIIEKSHFQAKL